MTSTEGFAQLRLRFTDPIQHDYEVIRPVVLFAKPVAVPSWTAITEFLRPVFVKVFPTQRL